MSEITRERLIVFTRYPEPGKTKTRLIPCLGPQGAAALQRRMTEHLLANVRRLRAVRPTALEIRYAGGSRQLMQGWLGAGLMYTPQSNGDLDRRMGRAFNDAFGCGVDAAVIIGTDIPGITAEILHQAFAALQNRDLVFGPACDGGYYLIGMHNNSFGRALPQLFSGIPWGSADVLDLSLKVAAKIGLTVALLEKLQDVDRPEDIRIWEQQTGNAVKHLHTDRISVIIPTLNEAADITPTLKQAQKGDHVETIIVDGGSRDNTTEIARSYGAKVLSTLPSRAGQMNAGASIATGKIYLFLHADTRLPDRFDVHVRQAMQQSDVAAGAFKLRIDSDVSSLRIMERVANLRSRYLKKPYGDQAIFLNAALFHSLGGFPDLPIMEDFELVRRLGKKGRIVILPQAVVTSPRRWLNIGVWRTWMINQLVILAYYLGVSPEKLAHFYRRGRGEYKKS
jgi:rSAM/selenodomain-associated transferase 2/rSAM/selenodomain-associated transferase 1